MIIFVSLILPALLIYFLTGRGDALKEAQEDSNNLRKHRILTGIVMIWFLLSLPVSAIATTASAKFGMNSYDPTTILGVFATVTMLYFVFLSVIDPTTNLDYEGPNIPENKYLAFFAKFYLGDKE